MKWEMVKLGDCSKLITGKTPPTKNTEYFDGGILWVNPSDFKSKYIEKTNRTISREAIEDNKSTLLPKNTILLSCIGDIGKVGILKDKGATNQQITAIILNDNLFPDFIYYYLISKKLELSNMANKSVVAILNNQRLNQFQIPLPPLTVQKEIAAILDTADALRKKDNELLKKYDELAQSIFIEMFGDPVRNEKGWEVKKLGDCIIKIQIGPFGTQLHEADYIQNGIPIINPMHMSDMKIHPNSNYSITKEKFNELKQYHLKKNDIILARRGELGRCAIVTESEKGFLCGTGSLFLTVNESMLHPLFLVYLLSRESMKKSLSNVATGTTMLNLNKDIVSNFMVIVPKIERQLDFIKSIEINEQNIALLKNQITHTNNLFHSLLQKAFKGELT
jgi:type I restriction enzyme S subunit